MVWEVASRHFRDRAERMHDNVRGWGWTPAVLRGNGRPARELATKSRWDNDPAMPEEQNDVGQNDARCSYHFVLHDFVHLLKEIAAIVPVPREPFSCQRFFCHTVSEIDVLAPCLPSRRSES
jgi:hypothetical protein